MPAIRSFALNGVRAAVMALWLLTIGSTMALAEPQAAQSPAPASSANAVSQAHASILSDGWNTTPAEASRLESVLVGDPHNVAARTRLISYYHQQMMAEPRTRHIFWLIENHPEAQIFRVAGDVTSMSPNWTKLNRDSDWNRARALWFRQIEQFPNNTLVLSNAAQALPLEDSIRLMGRLRVLEPDKPEWTVNLAKVYARAVRDVFFARDPRNGRRVFTSSMKYREISVMLLPIATPAAAERMEHELETSTDATLIGVTGELLVEEIGLLRPRESDTPEMVNSADFGKRLLERARSLEPGNPRWRQ
jgi:hypothetical protein